MKTILTLCLCALSSCPLLADESDVGPIAVVSLVRKEPVRFDKDIKPIFVSKCYVCHSGNVTEGGLNLSSHKMLLQGGDNGPAVNIGKAADSLLVKLAGRTAEPLMPPPEENDTLPLTPGELALIKLWIDQGAKPPAGTGSSVVLNRLSPSVRMVRAVAIAPDKSFVVAGRANQIHVYNATAGNYVRKLVDPGLTFSDGKPVDGAHLSIVESLAVSPDSRLLASGSFGDVALWDLATGQLQARLDGFAHRVVALDFSPDGVYLAISGGAPTVAGEIKVYQLGTEEGNSRGERRSRRSVTPGLVLELPAAHSDTVFGVRFSPDGGRLATCGADMSINVFAFPSGKRLKRLEGHTHHVLDVAWQADGALLASAGADKRVRLWDYHTGEQLTRINRGGGAINTVFLDHEKQVNGLTFVGDTTQILTCSGDQPARLWRLTKQMRPGNYAKPYIQGSLVRAFGDGTDYIYAAAASPDGAVVAVGGRKGVIWLHNGTDGELIGELAPPDDPAGPPVDPAGQSAAASGQEREVAIPSARQPQAVLTGHNGFINAVAYSPDGKLVASAGSDNGVCIWDAGSGKKLSDLTGHSDYVRCLAFSPDGAILASAGADQKIKLWRVATGEERATLWGHTGDVHSVTFAADGTLYSASRDGTIKAWDISTEQRPRILAEHTSPVRRVVLSPDQKTLASASGDGTIKLWDVTLPVPPIGQDVIKGVPRAILEGHTGDVMSVDFSADGKKLVSAAADKTIRLWDVATAKELRTIAGHSGVVYSAVFSPDGKFVASASGDQLIKLWDAESGEEKNTLKGHTGEVYFVTFSPDGKTLASASHDISVKLWDPQSGKERKTLKGHQGYIRALAFSADGLSLATASADRTVKLWDVQSGKAGKTFSGHTGIVFDVAFSVDGKTLASACGDESIKLWDVEAGTARATLNGHRGDVFSVLFSDDGKNVVSAGEDGTIRRWSTVSGRPPRTLTGHRDVVYSVAVSTDGKTLASCSYDGTIKLWDTQTDKQLATLSGHTHLIRCVAFSPDGKTLASASHDGTAKLWDVESRKQRATLSGHGNLVVAVAFSPDGKTLASASFDRTIRLWSVQTGEPNKVWKTHTGHLRCLALSPDGSTVATGSDDKTIKLWRYSSRPGDDG